MRRFLLTLAAGFAGATMTLLAPAPAASAAGCHPSYSPCVPDDGSGKDNVNCGDLKTQVKVNGPDQYKLDDDNDGIGCEGNPPAGGSGGTTPSASASPSGSVEPSNDPSADPSDVAGADGEQLPKTGVDPTIAVSSGVALLAAGGVLFWTARRRARHRFVA